MTKSDGKYNRLGTSPSETQGVTLSAAIFGGCMLNLFQHLFRQRIFASIVRANSPTNLIPSRFFFNKSRPFFNLIRLNFYLLTSKFGLIRLIFMPSRVILIAIRVFFNLITSILNPICTKKALIRAFL